jgi:hypothetical protein
MNYVVVDDGDMPTLNGWDWFIMIVKVTANCEYKVYKVMRTLSRCNSEVQRCDRNKQ